MSGVLAWGKREDCCAQAEIRVSDLHFPNVSCWSMRDAESVMIRHKAFEGTLQTFFSNTKRVTLLCPLTLLTGTHLPASLCFPHSGVSDSAPASFGPVCLANLVSQLRQCQWRSNNIQC